MATTSEIAVIARQILDQLNAAVEADEDLGRERRGIGTRLRALLTMTDFTTGPAHDARIKILTAIGRTKISDEIRRSGGCHIGAERSVQLAEDANLAMLADGLRQLAGLEDDFA